MCGIAGMWVRDPPVESELPAMVEALAHRGPDDRGLWFAAHERNARECASHVGPPSRGGGHDGASLRGPIPHPFGVPVHVALGHTRLAVIDLSPAGHQPMMDPLTGNCITYNGEVYNFREIRRTLRQRGVQFRSDSDTEVLLQAYTVWGPECVRRFRGMFAFAIWDEHAQGLFLARDRMGVKPLYYFQDDNGLLFASELRALLASGRVPRSLSKEGLASYLAFGSVAEPETIVAGVRMLPAGHTAVFDGRRLTTRRYWGLDGYGWEVEPPSHDDTLEAVRAELREAVRLRLVSDVPIGAFLSGGIDSSAVVSLMADGAPGRVKTVSMCFREAAFDESEHADLVARGLRTEHHAIVLTPAEVLNHMALALGALDQPSVDGLNTWFVSRAARQAGLTVALSGLGGDELFAGYSSFRTGPRLEQLRRLAALLPQPARNGLARVVQRGASAYRAGSGPRKLADLLAFAPCIRHGALVHRTLFGPHELARLMGEPPPKALPPCYHVSDELVNPMQPALRQISVMECGHYMRNTLLRDADVMSMAHALEVRVPLVDHLLLELVLGLDDRTKLDRRMPKPLLVRALEDKLPVSVVQRPKQGFTFPFQVWLRGPMGQDVCDALCSPHPALMSLLDQRAFARVWKDFAVGRLTWPRPWSLFTLSRWTEQNLTR